MSGNLKASALLIDGPDDEMFLAVFLNDVVDHSLEVFT